ncbi:MAG TPA: phosphopantetheine-binding protein [Gammaproteobacteria bacterium]|nr:phosphopantetheine-binding protein [Gammaproteobacteria bacterium]
MPGKDTYNNVVKILMNYSKADMPIDQITPQTSLLGDLKINSARLVDIIIDFEDTFDIAIDDKDADGVATVKDAVDLITNLTKQ